MCGIAGIINHEQYDLNKLKAALLHRGPDDQSIYVEKNLALVHTRLAIQDRVNGKQPFHFAHYSVIFNGEIYNHKDLRYLLSDFTFSTSSDTETLLYLYIKYGEAMFPLLDGMFAFCIFDRKNNTITLARDRAGKKPLYYIYENGSFLFSSELNALRSIKQLMIDENAIACYLRVGFIYKSYTPYKKVVELEPASYIVVDVATRSMRSKKYYNILDEYYKTDLCITFPDAVSQVEEKLKRSIRDRLLSSDVPVGIFLSGGIDSNLIVALASQLNEHLKTFTVKFTGAYDESSLARLTADKYKTTHTELELIIDINKDIEHILAIYGEPFMDSSAVPSFYVAQEAKKHVGVVLNGDGSDELFGGYRRYVPMANNLVQYAKLIAPFQGLLPKPQKKRSKYEFLYRLIAMAGKKNLNFYLSATSDLYEDVFPFDSNPILEEMDTFIASVLSDKRLTPLAKMLYLDFNLLLLSDLLVKMDIATMAHSLEGRSPFLSCHLLKLAPRLPDGYKVHKLTTKHILRELAKKYLPQELVSQPKRGFEVPLKRWVENDLKDKIYACLVPGCYSENYVNRSFIDSLLCNKINISAEKRARILWGLFCLEVWYARVL